MFDSTALLPVTIASAFAFGMVLALLGSIKLPLAKRLEIDEPRVGGLLSALNLALIPFMLISGILIDQMGIKWMLLGASLLVGLAMFALAVSRTYAGALYSILLAGAGGACVSTGAIVLMPHAFFKNSPAASLNLGNVFFGLGALVTPALADLLIRALGFRRALTLLAALCLVPALAASMTPGAEFPVSEHVEHWSVLGRPLLWLAGLVFMLYMPLEGALGTWATSYLTELGQKERRAAWLLSGFWLTFLAGRLLAGYLQQKQNGVLPLNSEPWLILALALGSAVLLGNLAGTRNLGTATLGLLALGACFGPIFPTLVGVLFNIFDDAEHGTAFGAMFAIGATGSLFLPPVIGAYARRTSVREALRIPTVIALLLAAAALALALSW
jgi:FHS family glucose/mannose:H+ symporter-like MFS transporter